MLAPLLVFSNSSKALVNPFNFKFSCRLQVSKHSSFLCMSSTLRLYHLVYELTVLIQVPSFPKHVTSLCSTFTAKFSSFISVIRSDNLHITKINFDTEVFHNHISVVRCFRRRRRLFKCLVHRGRLRPTDQKNSIS